MTAVLEETTVLSESLLDEEAPCTWDEPQCAESAAWVRVCPRCNYHRFRCPTHYASDMARSPSREIRCGGNRNCPHTATAAELNATFRPV